MLSELSEPSNIDTHQKNCSKELLNTSLLTFVDFFAGSGLVTQGAKHACTPVWSNDICPKKAAIYNVNHGTGQFFKTLELGVAIARRFESFE